MIAQVEVANPGFQAALKGLAHLGRAIDAAIRPVALASLGLPRVPVGARLGNPLGNNAGLINVNSPGAGADPADPGNTETDGAQQASYSVPEPQPPSIVPALPGLESLRWLSRSIAEALSFSLAPKLETYTQAIKDCCTKLGEAAAELTKAVASIETISKAIEACKCTSLSDEIKKRVDPITDGLRELPKPDLEDRFRIARNIGALIGTIVGAIFGRQAGAAAGLGVTGTVLGALRLYDELNPDPFTMRERSRRELKGLEELSEPALHPGPDSNLDNYDSFLFHFFDAGWRTWNSFLEELIRNIESPRDDPEANALRYDSLEVLPDIIKDYEESIELYRRLHGGESPKIDRRILDKAIELRKQGVDAPGPTSRYESGAPSALHPASYGPPSQPALPPASPAVPETSLEQLMQLVIARLKEPVRLEIRVLDDRVIARRLDGNRGVSVDFSRGPRMIGYVPV